MSFIFIFINVFIHHSKSSKKIGLPVSFGILVQQYFYIQCQVISCRLDIRWGPICRMWDLLLASSLFSSNTIPFQFSKVLPKFYIFKKGVGDFSRWLFFIPPYNGSTRFSTMLTKYDLVITRNQSLSTACIFFLPCKQSWYLYVLRENDNYTCIAYWFIIYQGVYIFKRLTIKVR